MDSPTGGRAGVHRSGLVAGGACYLISRQVRRQATIAQVKPAVCQLEATLE
jgi:hypothetical protein